jgi:hypothetical protein
LLRRRFPLGLFGAAVILASVVTVELLQHLVLRPILLDHGYRREDQSFPSGHAAVAVSVLAALAIVVPYRFRPLAVFLGSLWAASVGVATVTASWHRPSDTLGSDLVVVIYACIAIAILAWRGSVRDATEPTNTGRVLRTGLVWVYGAAALGTLGLAFAGALAAVRHSGSGTIGEPALTAGRAIALFGSTGVALTLLGLLRHVDLTEAAPVPTTDRNLA